MDKKPISSPGTTTDKKLISSPGLTSETKHMEELLDEAPSCWMKLLWRLSKQAMLLPSP
jgi:hypothetical protein